MSVDEMSGRALDLAVARHVFGHDVEERPNLRTGEMDAVYKYRPQDLERYLGSCASL